VDKDKGNVGTHGRGRENGGWNYRSVERHDLAATGRRRHGRSHARGRASLFAEWAQVWVGLGPFKPGWRVVSGRFNSGMGLHCSTRAGPLELFQLLEDFSNNQKIPNSKIQHLAILMSKNIQILYGNRLLQNGQLSFLAQLPIPSRFWIKNPGNKSKIKFA
jgi:hypothetical protein